jgi:hypothetical protein
MGQVVSGKDPRKPCFGRIMYGVWDKQTADQLTRTKQTDQPTGPQETADRMTRNKQTADVPSSTEHNWPADQNWTLAANELTRTGQMHLWSADQHWTHNWSADQNWTHNWSTNLNWPYIQYNWSADGNLTSNWSLAEQALPTTDSADQH